MVERKHSHPKAFGAAWNPVSRFQHVDEYDFRYYKYRIFDVVYEKKTEEFLDAYEKYQVWQKIKR